MRSMLQLLSVLLAVHVCTAEIREVHTEGRVSNHDQVMEISDIFEASRIFQGATDVMPEAIDPSNVPSLKVKTGLSAGCQSKICEMFYYALTSKALNLGFNKDCAAYFLGANFACPQFPSPDDFFNAPSVCANQMAGLVSLIATGNIVSAMTTYLGQTFETNSCDRHSYQNYQMTSRDFYYSCQDEFTNNATVASHYLLASKIQNFQQFRNQACTKNDNATNANCYVQLTKPAPTGTPTPNVFNQQCNYVGITAAMSGVTLITAQTKNNLAMSGICSTFKNYKCCAANNLLMLANGQTNTSNIKYFPPCLTTYLSNTCGIDFTNFCQNGSIASVSTIQATATVGYATGGKFLFPNMYNKTSALQLQGAISGVLGALVNPVGMATQQPWIFNAHYPFQVSIISYAYQYANGTTISKTDTSGNPSGEPYFPPEGDYEIAVAHAGQIKFTYQLTVQNAANQTQAQAFFAQATSINAMGFLNFVYGGATLSTVADLTPTLFYAAQPLVLPPHSSASSILGGHSFVLVGAVVTALTALWLL